MFCASSLHGIRALLVLLMLEFCSSINDEGRALLRFRERVKLDPYGGFSGLGSRIISIGRKVEDILVDPENKEWLSYSTELCGDTHISNTWEAKAFALLSEEGITKGIRRVTAVTTDCAINAKELAGLLDAEINNAYKAEGSLLEKKLASLKSKTDAAAIPAARKADLRTRISQLEDQVRKAKKKIGEENIQKAIKEATEIAETAHSEGKAFCITRVDVGADTTAVREAVLKVMDQKSGWPLQWGLSKEEEVVGKMALLKARHALRDCTSNAHTATNNLENKLEG